MISSRLETDICDKRRNEMDLVPLACQGDINRRAQRHSKQKKHNRSTKEVPPWNGQ